MHLLFSPVYVTKLTSDRPHVVALGVFTALILSFVAFRLAMVLLLSLLRVT